MKAYVFPGQGAQFERMGKDLYEEGGLAKELFKEADSLLGYSLSEVMFGGTAEALKQTRITQPAIFLHSTIKAKLAGANFQPDVVAGHSLGEFSALVANGALTFEDGLLLVQKRAMAMQKACEAVESTMAAIVGMEDQAVEDICAQITDTFHTPTCPIYQNVRALPSTNPEVIQQNLIAQLTAPVRWTQTMLNMIDAGVTEFVEVGGTGKVIKGMILRVNRRMPITAI